jgi:2-dehydropantoate 2-reductase
MLKKKVIILGAGAVGSILGAALSQNPEVEVTLIGRKDHMDHINKEGLEISGSINRTFYLNCLETLDFKLYKTLVVFTTKATDLKLSLKRILPLIHSTTQFLLTQNGLDVEDLFYQISQQKIKPEYVHRGIVGFGATFFVPGKVEYYEGKLILDNKFSASVFGGIFQNSFLPAFFSTNMQKLIWKKAIINSIYNPLSVILNIRNSVIAKENLNPIKEALLSEGTAVALSEGIEPGIDLEAVNNLVSSDNITSMLQDYKKGKHSEIDFINGAIARIGNKNNINTPTNDLIVNLIKALQFIKTENLAAKI